MAVYVTNSWPAVFSKFVPFHFVHFRYGFVCGSSLFYQVRVVHAFQSLQESEGTVSVQLAERELVFMDVSFVPHTKFRNFIRFHDVFLCNMCKTWS